jgi:hypothetical protein
MTIHQLERISTLVEQVIEKGKPKHPKIRGLCVKLANLDQVIAKKKDCERKPI